MMFLLPFLTFLTRSSGCTVSALVQFMLCNCLGCPHTWMFAYCLERYCIRNNWSNVKWKVCLDSQIYDRNGQTSRNTKRWRQRKFTCFDAKHVSGVIVLTFLFFLKIHILKKILLVRNSNAIWFTSSHTVSF